MVKPVIRGTSRISTVPRQWAHVASGRSREADGRPDVEDCPIRAAGIASPLDHPVRDPLKPSVVAIVATPAAAEGSLDDPDEVRVDHRHPRSLDGDADRSVDVLPNARMMSADRGSRLEGRRRRQPLEGVSPPTVEAEGSKLRFKELDSRRGQRGPIGVSHKKLLNEVGHDAGTRSLQEYLCHREPVWVAPPSPRKASAMDLEPASEDGTDAPGTSEVGPRGCARSGHGRWCPSPTLVGRSHVLSRSFLTIGVRRKTSQLKSIDLFAGAGGLSLGLHAAGFDSLLGVEASPDAAQTYFRNFRNASADAWMEHRHKPLREQILAGLAVARTSDVLSEIAAVRELLAGGELDLLAGGPPCQGFSLAGLRNPADPRNALAYDFLAFVEHLKPRAVLIENVEGIGYRFGGTGDHSTLAQLERALQAVPPGYVTKILELNARDFGIAQHRPRVLVTALRSDLAQQFDSTSHEITGMMTRTPTSSDAGKVVQQVSVHSALGDLENDGYRWETADQYGPDVELARRLRFGSDLKPPAVAEISDGAPPNHELRSHSQLVRKRFRLLLAIARHGMHHSIVSVPRRIEGQAREAEISRRLAAANPVLVFPLVNGGDVIADSRADFVKLLDEVGTLKHSQRALLADATAPTMLSLPDDHVHYLEPRTLTVREVARLQSFPDSFVFYGKATTGGLARRREVPQYTQVANAVPPQLARSVGICLKELLEIAIEQPRSHQATANAVVRHVAIPAVAT